MCKRNMLVCLCASTLVLSYGLRAAEVSATTAKRAAMSWLGRKAERTKFGFPEKRAVRTDTCKNAADKPLFHVVSLENGGYVVTSGDTKVSPIIAFSRTGDFSLDDGNPLADILRADMSNRLEVVTSAQTSVNQVKLATASASAATNTSIMLSNSDMAQEVAASEAAWDDLLAQASPKLSTSSVALSSSSDSGSGGSGGGGGSDEGGVYELPNPKFVWGEGVAPFIKSKWGQSDAYGKHIFNLYTPNNYPCGCVTMAFAQILRWYWSSWYSGNLHADNYNYDAWAKYLRQGTNGIELVKTKRNCKVDGTGWQLESKGDWYDIRKMPYRISSTITDEERSELGKLAYDLSVFFGASFAAKGTSVDLFHAGNQFYFAYNVPCLGLSCREFLPTENLSTVVNNALITSLELGSPCIISITASTTGAAAHAAIVDGYARQNDALYLHLNCGWYGTDDLWYNINGNGLTRNCYKTVTEVVYNFGYFGYGVAAESGTGITYGRVVASDGTPVYRAKVYYSDEHPDWYRETWTDGVFMIPTSRAKTIYATWGDGKSVNTEKVVIDTKVYDSVFCRYAYPNYKVADLVINDSVRVRETIDTAQLEITPNGIATITGSGTLPHFKSTELQGCKEIRIGSGFTAIAGSAFSGCSSVTNIVIPEGVKKIEGSAFSYCSNLESVSFPRTLTSLDDSIFYGCSSMKWVDVADLAAWCSISRTASSYNDWNYYLCTNGEYVLYLTIPEGVRYISSRAFAGLCRGVGIITIPEGVSSIGNGAFTKCYNLIRVNLPSTLRELSNGSFTDSNQMSEFQIAEDSPYLTNIGGLVYSKDRKTLMACPVSKSSCSLLAGITTISKYAFYQCQNLKKLTLPESVSYIGGYAFYGCKYLQEINMPESVSYIGDYAFYECEKIREIRIPSLIKELECYTFAHCTSLAVVSLPAGLKAIWHSAFDGCCLLESIAIPTTVQEIGDDAFQQCRSLTHIVIPSNVKRLGNYAFDGCSALTNVCFSGSNPKYYINPFRNINAAAIGTYVAYYDEWQSVLKDGKFDELQMVYTPALTGPGRSDDFDFETDGTANWTGQTQVTFDGRDALQSGAIKDGELSRMYASTNGPGVLTFKWRVSSETEHDYLELWADGEKVDAISGEIGEWRTVDYVTTNAGPHTFEWIYRKDASGCAGADAGFVDQVKWCPLIVSDGIAFRNADTGLMVYDVLNGGEEVKIPATVDGLQVVGVRACALDGVKETMSSLYLYGSSSRGFDWNGIRNLSKLSYVYVAPLGADNCPNEYFGSGEVLFGTASPYSLFFVPMGRKSLIPKSYNNVATILDAVARVHTNLTSVTFDSSLKHIGVESFYGCTGLTQLSIPASVTNIGERAFAECANLTSITFEGLPLEVAFESSFPAAAYGYYRVANKAAWEAVLVDGKWKGLPMSCTGKNIHIDYLPGRHGTGDSIEKSVYVEQSEAFNLEGRIFNREGYHQIGWSTTDGGEREYYCGQTIRVTEDVEFTLYPVWKKIDGDSVTSTFIKPVVRMTRDDFADVDVEVIGGVEFTYGVCAADGKTYYFVESARHLSTINTDGDSRSYDYVLMCDLDLSASTEWSPIGTDAKLFKGTFDGNGFTISHVEICNTNRDDIGLFGKVKQATIKNVCLKTVSVSGRSDVGALVGHAYRSQIENCAVIDSDVSGVEYVGGLVGCSDYSIISSCSVTHVDLSAAEVGDTMCFGGLIGWAMGSSLNECCVEMEFTGESPSIGGVGGFVAFGQYSAISNCLAMGTIQVEAYSVGGFLGYSEDCQIVNSLAAVEGDSTVGGFFGVRCEGSVAYSFFDSNLSCTTNEISELEESSGEPMTTLFGKMTTELQTPTTFLNVGWDSNVWHFAEGKYPQLLPFVEEKPKTYFIEPVGRKTRDDFTNIVTKTFGGQTLTGGRSVEDGKLYYFIDSEENLMAVDTNPITRKYNYILMCDIDISTITSISGSNYSGTFDGNGYVISGLVRANSARNNMSLLGKTNGATIKNLALEDSSIVGGSYVGALVGEAYNSTIYNCYVRNGSVSGDVCVGMLIGYSNGSTVENCFAEDGCVSGNACVGLLIGGCSESTIKNSFASKGTVSGNANVDLLMGLNNESTVENCFTEQVYVTGVREVVRQEPVVPNEDVSYSVTFENVTVTNTFAIPEPWFTTNGVDIASGVTKAILTTRGRNGIPRYESFLFGLEPESEEPAAEQFKTLIDGFDENGLPKIRFSPDLSGDTRVNQLIRYTELGKPSLTSETWTPVTDANRSEMHFFKVQVEMR